jgi:hypothetical protein
MKHIKMFEDFIGLNERITPLKPGRDEEIAKGILGLYWAPDGSGREDVLYDMGLHPNRTDSKVGQTVSYSAWGKDIVKALSGAKRVPSEVMVGNVVALAAGNGKSYYFDGGDFVEGSQTIIPNALNMTWTQFIAELINQGIIAEPIYK